MINSVFTDKLSDLISVESWISLSSNRNTVSCKYWKQLEDSITVFSVIHSDLRTLPASPLLYPSVNQWELKKNNLTFTNITTTLLLNSEEIKTMADMTGHSSYKEFLTQSPQAFHIISKFFCFASSDISNTSEAVTVFLGLCPGSFHILNQNIMKISIQQKVRSKRKWKICKKHKGGSRTETDSLRQSVTWYSLWNLSKQVGLSISSSENWVCRMYNVLKLVRDLNVTQVDFKCYWS